VEREQTYRVVGIQNGERFIITERTTREMARRIANLIRVGSRFSELVVEPAPEDIGRNEPSPLSDRGAAGAKRNAG